MCLDTCVFLHIKDCLEMLMEKAKNKYTEVGNSPSPRPTVTTPDASKPLKHSSHLPPSALKQDST